MGDIQKKIGVGNLTLDRRKPVSGGISTSCFNLLFHFLDQTRHFHGGIGAQTVK